MRGILQELMGAEVAAMVSEAGRLASHHGHRRVTPLHVASAILSSSSSRAAGDLLRLSSHPLRLEDLKVSLDTALSRLPVAGAAHPLDLSNALVAVLKRAQTIQHRRRSGRCTGRSRRRKVTGGVKVDLEHLVTSLVDDPSVHRAMCVAGQSKQARAGVQPSAPATVLHRPAAANLTCHRETREAATASVSLPQWFQGHQDMQHSFRQNKFDELSATNFKIICEALETHVPQHRHIIPSIASTVLSCRSGTAKRARSLTSSTTTWLLFHGDDYYGKKAMAQELAKVIFGSYTDFSMVTSLESSSDTNGNLALNTNTSPVMTTLVHRIRENPHRVMFIDGINQRDYESEIVINNLIATGTNTGCNGSGMLNLEDAIIVFSSKTFASFPVENHGIANRQSRKEEDAAKEKGQESRTFNFDLNACIEDVEEEDEKTVDNNAWITRVMDGVFRFD